MLRSIRSRFLLIGPVRYTKLYPIPLFPFKSSKPPLARLATKLNHQTPNIEVL